VTRWLAGIVDPRGRADAARLASALSPDSATIYSRGPLQVAYTGAAQTSRGMRCLLDGYLYNAQELAKDLGIQSDSPPEDLLVAGWRRWGRDLLPRLRGDFALLLWDPEREEGLLARDQLGVRSMFLHDAPEGLYFASEVRYMLALLPRRPTPDTASVAHWLTMSNRPGSATLYQGIRRLNPGGMLWFGRDGVHEETYWRPRFREPAAEPQHRSAEAIRDALERALRRRLDPDRTTGVLMSGGLDSGSVAAMAAKVAPGAVNAYSGVFPDHPAVDESSLIDGLRHDLDLPGMTAEVRAGGLLASALQAVATWQMPLRGWGDFWAVPLLRAAAGKGVRVMLGGDGGDELFGSRSYLLADRLRGGHLLQAISMASQLPGAAYGPPRREIAKMVGSMAVEGALPYRVHELLRRPLERRGLPSWLRPDSGRALLDSDDPFAWKRLDGPRWWSSVAYGLTRGIEEAGVFEDRRRRAASAGLEARHPLFDLDLVELGLGLAPLASFDRFHNRPVLRAAMAGLLPDSVRLNPDKAWFDTVIIDSLTGPDAAATRRILTDRGSELGAYVDQRAIAHALFETDRLRREQPFRWMWQIWRLLTAEFWLRAQAHPPIRSVPDELGISTARVDLSQTP
jgi:asparagine synthase (glutamine-hydrolysing)